MCKWSQSDPLTITVENRQKILSLTSHYVPSRKKKNAILKKKSLIWLALMFQSLCVSFFD